MKGEVRGIPELMRRLTPELVAPAAAKFLNTWRLSVEGNAKRNVFKRARDRSHLGRGIASEIDTASPPLFARVGVRRGIPQAEPMEFGTGLLADAEAPNASRRRHWPPAAELQDWAERHGFEDTEKSSAGAQVARIIGLRGGLKPRRYLRDARDDASPRLSGWLGQMARDIERDNNVR